MVVNVDGQVLKGIKSETVGENSKILSFGSEMKTSFDPCKRLPTTPFLYGKSLIRLIKVLLEALSSSDSASSASSFLVIIETLEI